MSARISGRRSTGHELGLKQKGPAHSIAWSTVIMMAGLLLSKISGQLREILIVPMLGYGTVSDAYVIGFQIPDLFYQLLVGGAIQAAITPTLAAAIEKHDEKKGWRSLSIFINFTGLAMLLAILAGELLAPHLIGFYNSTKPAATIDLAIRVTRSLFPQVLFMMLAALCIGILNAYKKFSSTSFGPTVYNVCVVLAMLFLGKRSPDGAVRVASGVMAAAAIYFVFQFVMARKELGQYVPSLDWRDRGFRRLLHLALPTLISGSIVQINTIILTGFADDFDGVATSLRQASTTWQLPYGIIAVAIGNVMLPTLAGMHAARDYQGSRRLYGTSLRRALFMVVPFAALFLAMQEDVIKAIFQWGTSLTDAQVVTAAGILSWYCLAMVAQTIVFITNQAFYARRMTRIALLNGLITLILNPLFCQLFTRLLKLGASGLSLSYTLTSLISAYILYMLYRRQIPEAAPARLFPYLLRVLICAAAAMLVLMAMNALPIQPELKPTQLLWFGFRAVMGLFTYYTTAVVLNIRETEQIKGLLERLGKRMKRS